MPTEAGFGKMSLGSAKCMSSDACAHLREMAE